MGLQWENQSDWDGGLGLFTILRDKMELYKQKLTVRLNDKLLDLNFTISSIDAFLIDFLISEVSPLEDCDKVVGFGLSVKYLEAELGSNVQLCGSIPIMSVVSEFLVEMKLRVHILLLDVNLLILGIFVLNDTFFLGFLFLESGHCL